MLLRLRQFNFILLISFLLIFDNLTANFDNNFGFPGSQANPNLLFLINFKPSPDKLPNMGLPEVK